MSDEKEKVVTMKEIEDAAAKEIERRVAELGLDRPERPEGLSKALAESAGRGLKGQARRKAADFLAAWVSGDRAQVKALSEGSDPAGGYLVPEELRGEVIQRAREATRLSKLVRHIGCRSSAVKVPTLSTDVSVYWGSEGGAFDESDPVFGQKSITINRLNALTKISRELVADAGIDLVDYLSALFAEAVAVEEDRVIAVGDGSTQPEGLYSAAGVQEYDVGGAVDYEALVDIYYTLPGRYRDRAVWLGSDDVFKAVRKLTDTAGQPLWRPSLEADSPDRLLGRAVVTQSDLPSSVLLFGDPRYYHLYDREELAVEASTQAGTAFAAHQLWLKVWERVDGKLMLAESWVKGTGITG
ncbi:MAG: phage major capsid protein [Planctomycetota bacterium]|jgi:HK97 family phage major capsid protein